MLSPVLIDASLNIFYTKAILSSFIQTRKFKIRPIDGWQTGENINFVIPNLEQAVIPTDSFEICMTSQILSEDGKKPEATVKVAPLNGSGILCFESITCQIGSDYLCGDTKSDVYKVL